MANADIPISYMIKDIVRRTNHCDSIETGNFNKTSIVVAIAGCTSSGKTTFATKLVNMLVNEGEKAVKIDQDIFFKHEADIDKVISEDDPTIIFYHCDKTESIDEQGLLCALQQLKNENSFVIIDGNMLTELETVCSQCSYTIFFTNDRDRCFKYRQMCNYDIADKPGYFDQIVWPAYCRHLSNALSLAKSCIVSIEFLDSKLYDFFNPLTIKKVFRNLSMNLVKIQQPSIQVQEALKFVTAISDGGISVFIGTTRNCSEMRNVVRLEYEAYDMMSLKLMQSICECVREIFPNVDRIAIVHRIGCVPVGEASVLIAVSAPHRYDAIKACEFSIDELKRKLPIWKKEVYEDGSSSWKENPVCKSKQNPS